MLPRTVKFKAKHHLFYRRAFRVNRIDVTAIEDQMFFVIYKINGAIILVPVKESTVFIGRLVKGTGLFPAT